MSSMVPVQIVGLQLDPGSGVSVVLLRAPTDPDRVLPILIGPAEAQSIAIAVSGVELPRPGSHDLMAALLEHTDSQLEEVVVTELVEGTFHAELFLETPAGLRRVSCRPSDAIALAIRVEAPVAVNVDVLDAAAVSVEHESGEPFTEEDIDRIVDEFHEFLSTADPADFARASGEGTGDHLERSGDDDLDQDDGRPPGE